VLAPPTWIRLCPVDVLRDPVLLRAAELLAAPETRQTLLAGQAAGEYPAATVAALQQRGIASLFTAGADVFRLCALNSLSAACDGSLAITLGVNALALLPVHLGGSPGLQSRVFDRVDAGAFCGLLLTELDHGSNLLRNTTAAIPDGDSFTINGEKHLINGATRHDLLITLLRTASGNAVAFGDFSVFLVERDATVESLPRWSTLPMRAADIAGVRFHGTRVGRDALVGDIGGGFNLIQRALTLSRGGISALASGCASGAAALARQYAHTRDVYGGPIVALDAIADHLARQAELELAVAALSVKSALAANALGTGAAAYTAAAKLACCALAEESVDQGRRVVSSRALLADQPYERFVRDVLLFGVFDGTSHLMLNELGSRLPQIAKPRPDDDPPLTQTRALFSAPKRPLSAHGDQRTPTRPIDLAAHVRALDGLPGTVSLAPLTALTDALLSLVRSLRGHKAWSDQGVRFPLAESLAWLEAQVALVELCDPPRRAALGAPELPAGQDLGDILRGALATLGLRLRARLLDAAAAADLPVPEDMSVVERDLLALRAASRLGARAHVRG
jgi:alkylation response protein AidB-like acyl-CoA dehydrogenase